MMRRIILLVVALLAAVPAYAGQGWYRLVPWKTGPEGVREPLPRWDHQGGLDTAVDCENALTRHIASREQRRKEGKDDEQKQRINQQVLDRLTWARCIASDD